MLNNKDTKMNPILQKKVERAIIFISNYKNIIL
nr:MAG TPA: hypothetical protein [Caudoviricetes sp.]